MPQQRSLFHLGPDQFLKVRHSLGKAAPGFDKAHWPNMADRTWAAEVSAYYSAKPYWA